MKNGVTYLSKNWQYQESLSDVRRDFQRFSDDGLELICMLTHWQNFEPTKGNYNSSLFYRMNTITDIANEHGIRVIHNIHTTYKGNDVPSYVGNFAYLFSSDTLYQAHLDALKEFCSRLDKPNVYGFQIHNEPVNADWGIPAGVEAWTKLFRDSVNACRTVTAKPISARIAAGCFKQFDDRVFDIFDFMSINYYEQYHKVADMQSAIQKTHGRGKRVILSEFGKNTTDDASQAAAVRDYLELFKSLEVEMTTVWWWCPGSGPSSYGYNINDYTTNTPRPAYDVVVELNDPSPPPIFPLIRVRLYPLMPRVFDKADDLRSEVK